MVCHIRQSISIIQAKIIASKAKMESTAELVVYTAVIGNYDDPPVIQLPQAVGVDFICISDRKIKVAAPWKLVLVDKEVLSSRVQAKIYKLFPHELFPNTNKSIWIDGTFRIIGDVSKLIYMATDELPMAVFSHPSRTCAYAEAKACMRLGKEKKDIIDIQMNTYREAGFKKNMGLLHGGVLIRKHNDDNVKKVMEEWWSELCKYSMRDQLSFNYVAWKNNFVVRTLDDTIYNNGYFVWTSHKNPEIPVNGNGLYWFWVKYYRLTRLVKRIFG